jgi:hypothetical protein
MDQGPPGAWYGPAMASDLAPLFEGLSPEVATILLRLREVVHEELPGVTEQLDLPDRLVAYGYGPASGVRMQGFFIALIPHKAHVNVQLADGASLHDPSSIVEGTGKRVRHVKCRSLDDAERPALRALIREQAAFPG